MISYGKKCLECLSVASRDMSVIHRPLILSELKYGVVLEKCLIFCICFKLRSAQSSFVIFSVVNFFSLNTTCSTLEKVDQILSITCIQVRSEETWKM